MYDNQALAVNVKCPALVMHGMKDSEIHHSHGKLIFDKLQSREEKEQFKTYAYWSKTAGHDDVFYDNPRECIRQVQKFVRTLPTTERIQNAIASSSRTEKGLSADDLANPSLGSERRRENKEKKPYNDKFNRVNQELFYESPPRKTHEKVMRKVFCYVCAHYLGILVSVVLYSLFYFHFNTSVGIFLFNVHSILIRHYYYYHCFIIYLIIIIGRRRLCSSTAANLRAFWSTNLLTAENFLAFLAIPATIANVAAMAPAKGATPVNSFPDGKVSRICSSHILIMSNSVMVSFPLAIASPSCEDNAAEEVDATPGFLLGSRLYSLL